MTVGYCVQGQRFFQPYDPSDGWNDHEFAGLARQGPTATPEVLCWGDARIPLFPFDEGAGGFYPRRELLARDWQAFSDESAQDRDAADHWWLAGQ